MNLITMNSFILVILEKSLDLKNPSLLPRFNKFTLDLGIFS